MGVHEVGIAELRLDHGGLNANRESRISNL
jgi:hypothetical protein